MKRSIVLLLSLFVSCMTFAHISSDSLFSITIEPGADNKDMRELMSFMNIEKLKIRLSGSSLGGKRVNIGYKEYKEGKMVSTRLLVEGMGLDKYCRVPIGDTQFVFSVLAASGIEDSTIKIKFYYPRLNFDYKEDGLAESGYSLRVLQDDKNTKYATGKQIAILCYSLPHKIDGTNAASYCALTSAGVPPSEWYSKYKVKHYIVYYIEVVK